MFPSPHHLNEPERRWDSSNSAKAVARVIGSSDFAWATPHTLRRTVATLFDQAGATVQYGPGVLLGRSHVGNMSLPRARFQLRRATTGPVETPGARAYGGALFCESPPRAHSICYTQMRLELQKRRAAHLATARASSG